MGKTSDAIQVIALDMPHNNVIRAMKKMEKIDPIYVEVIDLYLHAWREIILSTAVRAEDDVLDMLSTTHHTRMMYLDDIADIEASIIRMCVQSLPVSSNVTEEDIQAELDTGYMLYYATCLPLADLEYVKSLRMRAITEELTALLKRNL